jgi:hypothetical protein
VYCDDETYVRPLFLPISLSIILRSGLDSFPAVLTSGLWLFFCFAVAHEDGVNIYESEFRGWAINGRMDGLIVATLVELIRNPCTLLPIFELERL